MCGLAAIITRSALDLRPCIDAMTDSFTHRGPDDRGVAAFEREGVALGMRRLSIVDLQGGAQPMRTEDRRFSLVFNGEIYNAPDLRRELVQLGHHFRSHHSDTEVMLHGFARWGHDVWPRLNRMFAVLIWDRQRRVLVAARDRLGQETAVRRSVEGG